ncbi:MAG: MFS transporter [Gammaproteobacteria bacterium]
MTNPAAAPLNRGPLAIAAVCVLVYFFTNGMSLFVPQNLFPRFMETFGATAAEVSRTTALTFGISGLLAPFVGAAIDRFGVVRVIRTGLVVLGLTFIAYPAARSLADLYLLHVAIAVGLILSGLMPNVVLLSRWFRARSGTAVGVLVAGSSLAGATLPLAISPLVNDPAWGWRAGMAVLAAAFWLLAVLPAFLVLREAPVATAMAVPETGSVSKGTRGGTTFAAALRTRTLWCLAIGSACLWFAIQATTSQITIYFEQEAGLAPQRATALFSTILASSVAGKFLFGAVSDRFRKQQIMVVTSLTLLAGCLLLFAAGDNGLELTRDPGRLTAFAVVFGLGFGGSFTLIQLVAVESFGQLALGRILGVVTFVDTMGGAAGTLLAGQIRTATGDYFVTFALVAVVALIAVANVLLIRPVVRITNA